MQLSEIVSSLQLKPHPEGGYYRETYRSSGKIPPHALDAGFDDARNYSTAIYFLLTRDNFSAFHRVRQDEMWHFYLGSPIELLEITAIGELKRTSIGNQLENGHQPQYLVPGGHWFASRVLPRSGEYALAGCTVAPGFDFRDFALAKRADLLRDFPEHADIILALTRE